MPNGWSGGFYLRRKQLETLLVNLGDRVELGRTVRKPVTSSDCVEILNRWNDEQFLVEEHDHEWYVIQFPEPKDWIVVTNKSALFDGLRQHHMEWRKKSENK